MSNQSANRRPSLNTPFHQRLSVRRRLSSLLAKLGLACCGLSCASSMVGCAQTGMHTASRGQAKLAPRHASIEQTRLAANRNQPAATTSVMPASYQTPVESTGVSPNAPALVDGTCPTTDTVCAPSGQPCPNFEAACFPTAGAPQYWNDQEYLIDGGDREPAVQITEDWRVHGLDSQDTIAHYETLNGKLCVAATNRVPIYAPRFGAVRKTTSPVLAAGAVGARRLVEPNAAIARVNSDSAGQVAQPVPPMNQEVVKLIDGLRDRTRGVGTEQITPAVDLSSYQRALARLQNHTTSVRREDLLAILGEYMVNARTWSSNEGVGVAMGGVKAVQVRDAKEVQDITVFETEPDKCSLRICKAASHSAAHPGDIISFSIRFDNIGNKPIGNLVILDSLVTRLEYIDGSQQCVLSLASHKLPDAQADKQPAPVKFSTAENEAGSTVLRWEAETPLDAGDSGVITFRCRVR